MARVLVIIYSDEHFEVARTNCCSLGHTPGAEWVTTKQMSNRRHSVVSLEYRANGVAFLPGWGRRGKGGEGTTDGLQEGVRPAKGEGEESGGRGQHPPVRTVRVESWNRPVGVDEKVRRPSEGWKRNGGG